MDSRLLLTKEGSEVPLAAPAGAAQDKAGNMNYGSASMLALETMPVIPGENPNVECRDMSKLSYITNSVVAELIRMVRSALKQGKELRLINVPETLKTMIRKMGLGDIIKCS